MKTMCLTRWFLNQGYIGLSIRLVSDCFFKQLIPFWCYQWYNIFALARENQEVFWGMVGSVWFLTISIQIENRFSVNFRKKKEHNRQFILIFGFCSYP